MNIFKRNIVSNFGGMSWKAIMNLIFLPLYIHFLGIEAFGIVGIFTSLIALSILLDMGLSATLTREMARLAIQPDKSREMRDIVRTLEVPYWLVSLLIVVIVVLVSPIIAYHWIEVKTLSPKTVQTALMIMSLAIALRLPLSCYTGGLIGLQRQVLLNVLNMIMATSRGLGSVLILWLVSPTLEAFFLWQAAVSVAHVGLIAFFFWRALPTIAEPPRFRRELLLNIWRFAAGMMGINVLVTILLQEDKIILSRMLNLELFGYYTLAFTIAASMSIFTSPVFKATYPRLTNLVTLGSTKELIRLYHESAQLVAVFLLPAAIIVTLFSKEILLLWTQNPETAEQTHLLVSILVIGTALNGLMTIPYALQLAFGWTRLALFFNLVAVLTLVPLIIVLTTWYGAVGAASVWVILHSAYFIFGIQLVHRRLLPTEKWRWYFQDVGLPLGVAVLVAVTLRLIIPIPVQSVALVALILMVSAITLGATALATPVTRNWLWSQILDWRVSRGAKS